MIRVGNHFARRQSGAPYIDHLGSLPTAWAEQFSPRQDDTDLGSPCLYPEGPARALIAPKPTTD
jgi:hypothetical protein